ncbi:hypothetical protein N7492_010572 [Penicillium capsulatum]|uniref:RING-type domain-containing protein n=1 Tax=Penicillium capsulatum TaxID=69766 RepID=A0A9W9HP99_9EURO|nr:hypothetical protein N7492_010572 [Penicillium capsulatum]KAJ6113072.1 hypothetical protein N7512_008396 [Penicillium capsulatum]
MSRRHSVVDLTAGLLRRSSTISLVESSSSQSAHNSRTAHPVSPTMARGTKRRRVDDSPISRPHNRRETTVESVDLTELDASSSLAKTLAKQREDAIKAQQSADLEKAQSVLTEYRCPVCMDIPENATSTICGHLFCHSCIFECLSRASEHPLDSNKHAKGTCPVCRKSLTTNDAVGPRRSLIPLKFKLTTKKRSTVAAAQA